MKMVIYGAPIALLLSAGSSYAMGLTDACSKMVGAGQHIDMKCWAEIGQLTVEEAEEAARIIGNGDTIKQDRAYKIIGNGNIAVNAIIGGNGSPAPAKE